MSNTYSDATSASTSSFVTSLIVNSAVAGGELAAFIAVRRWIKAIYEPRTYIPPKDLQAPVLGSHLLWPLWRIVKSDPEEILAKNGVDPYTFVRFLLMMAKAMVPIWLISWVILFPIDAVNSTVDGKSGLDKYTFGNVASNKQSRYWAHLILDYIFIFWIMWLIWHEMRHWLTIRQRHLVNPEHSKLPQARTVLITGIPHSYLDEVKLEQLFARLPGGVKQIWLNRNLKEMPDLYNRRDVATKKLESAQVKLIKMAQQHRDNTREKITKLEKKGKPVPEDLRGPVNPDLLRPVGTPGTAERGDVAFPMDNATLSRADQLVPRGQRPMTRLKPSWAPFGLGFLGIGEKVDTIDWARKEIAECSEGLEKSREQLRQDVESPGTKEDNYPPLNSAFIHFNQQIAAHMAVQCLPHHQPYRMAERYIEQSPENVVWRNLSLDAYEASVRRAASIAITVGLIILWTFPVAFIGALSNVTTLTEKYSWMAWLGGSSIGKKILQGVVSGVLPPILLAVLNLLLPIVLRQLLAFEGVPSKTAIEIDLTTRYFIFLVIHTFFVVTLSSGLVSSIPALASNPASVADILAQQMPTASTFFITLLLTQFTGTMGTLLQGITLLLYYVKVLLLGGSPRSVYNSRYQLQTTSWGTQFPNNTVYAVITLVYKYLFIWVYDQPPGSDTGGLFFPKAITHVFVGMYIQEVCLCALFFLARDENLNASSIPQAVLMIVLIVITAAVHYTIIVSYGPLINALPLSLAHLSYGAETEMGHEGSIIGSDDDDDDDEREHSGDKARSSSKTRLVQSRPSEDINPDESDKNNDIAVRDFGDKKPPVSTDTISVEPEPEPPATSTAPGPPEGESHPFPFKQPPQPPISSWATSPPVEEQVKYFAVPGGPGVRKRKLPGEDDPDAFFHPATKDPQRIIWLPRDQLGLADDEIERNAAAGVQSTNLNAVLNGKGKVEISGGPPDDL
ncbi:hypothetical protein EHS25_009500 [Saitozyma podzolica]|uniref:DUF221-domain-containing protein n=1 Tax=Saitozyma podzolica TaxID=1890683 RepID=A0A427YJD5_9TREE|nr:hypothetical protein EHS25_009500 [Saitozyma podzolica]